MLFSQASRHDFGPKPHGEPEFEYLDRSARREAAMVRDVWTTWFDRFPPLAQEELKPRFQDCDDAQHVSAAFELYLHETFLRLGYTVGVHPRVALERGRRPDFQIRQADGGSLYVEAVLATETTDRERGVSARRNQILDALNEVECADFYLSLTVRQVPPATPSIRRLQAQVSDWLRQLDPDAVQADVEASGFGRIPQREFGEAGLRIRIAAIPRSPERRALPGVRPVASFSLGARWVGTSRAIRSRLRDKARRYGQLDGPLVIAVNASDRHVRDDVVADALFGDRQVLVSARNPDSPPQLDRARNGLWTSRACPTYTRVSGVLVTGGLGPWTPADCSLKLFHNPWAAVPLRGTICELDQAILEDTVLRTVPGAQPRELLGLPPGWPAAS